LNERATLRLANLGLHAADDRFARQTTVSLGPILFAQGPANRTKEPAIALRLAGVTLIVLLIAIANVSNLLLTRAMQRQREIAVRVALGISRQRLAAMLITESGVLAVFAGLAALVVATWGAQLIRSLLLPDVNWGSAPFDLRLVGWTLVVTLGAGAFAGILPFSRTGRLDLAGAMRGGQRDGSYRSRARSALIMAQAALSVVLLAGAALFLRSLREVRSLDLGYDMNGTLTVTLQSGPQVIPPLQMVSALAALQQRAGTIPGVQRAALAGFSPMRGFMADVLLLASGDSLPKSPGGPPTFIPVGPGFLDAAGVRLIAGRDFSDADGESSPRVMIVNETMARLLWPDGNAIGQCLHVTKPASPCTTVIGVTKDARMGEVIEDPMMQYYLPLSQAREGRAASALIVRTTPDRVPAVKREIRALVAQVVPGARSSLETLAEHADPQYRPWRVGAALFTAFGILALLVAAIGVYSAVAYAVTQRSHELGVRIALGAQRRDISRLVIGSGLRVVGGGVALGIVAALALGRLIESLLYGTTAKDPVVLALVAMILLVVAIVASSLPAWRAARLDPVTALRAE
jgi:predicted permease